MGLAEIYIIRMMVIAMMKTTMLDVIGMVELVVTMKCQIGTNTVMIVNVLNPENNLDN